ncbi:MAG: HAD family hydrolase [Vicinamibacterales bacterium]
MSPAAVVFDFDGVIANSEPLHFEALRAVLAGRGYELPRQDYYAHFLGYNDEDALSAISTHYGWPLAQTERAALVDEKLQTMVGLLGAPDVLYPDAASCVRRLSRTLPLAIASGAKRDEIELVLHANDLAGQFRCIVASGETARSKPAPDPYARAVELLVSGGAMPPSMDAARRCVAIEDSAWGIQSAKRAGLRCIAITTSYPAADLADADVVVDALTEVTPELLARIVGAAAC